MFGFHLFLSKGLYGHRPATHRRAYIEAPGWYMLELGSLTLDIHIPDRLAAVIHRTKDNDHEDSVLREEGSDKA